MARERGKLTTDVLQTLVNNHPQPLTRDALAESLRAERSKVYSSLATLIRAGEVEERTDGYRAVYPIHPQAPTEVSDPPVWEKDEQVIADLVEEAVESLIHELTKDARFDISILGLVENNRKVAVEHLTNLVLLAGPINN